MIVLDFQSYLGIMGEHSPVPQWGRWIIARHFLPDPRGNLCKLGNKWGIEAEKPLKIGSQGMRSLDEMQKKLYYL